MREEKRATDTQRESEREKSNNKRVGLISYLVTTLFISSFFLFAIKNRQFAIILKCIRCAFEFETDIHFHVHYFGGQTQTHHYQYEIIDL